MADAAGGDVLARSQVVIGAKLDAFDAALASVRSQLTGIERRFAQVSNAANVYLAGAARRAVGTLAGSFGQVIHAASELQESTSKANTVFGDSFAVVEGHVNALADRFGVVKAQVLDATANFGQFAQGLGQTEAESARFANTFTKLALDLKSFNNNSVRTFEDAMVKIQAALAGETEPLMRFGVDVRETTVKQFALARGLATAGREMTNQEKTTARAALIMEKLKNVSGDLDRTIGDFANSSQAVEGRLTNLAAKVGEELLPAFTDWKNLLNEVLIDFTKATDGMKSKLDWLKDQVQAGVNAMSSIWRNWDLIVERAGIQLAGFAANVGEVLAWLGDVFQTFLDWFGETWPLMFKDAFDATLTIMGNFKDNFLAFTDSLMQFIASGFQVAPVVKFKPLLEGFDPQTPPLKLPDMKLSDVSEELRKIDEKMTENEVKAIQAREKAREKEGKDKQKPARIDEQGKQQQKPEFIGIAEFAKKIQSGLGADKEAGRTANATERTATAVEKMAAKVQAGGRLIAVAAGPE
jgi:hypothetical protein